MGATGQSGSARINLEKAVVLVVDSNTQGQEIIVQIVTGFGVKAIHRADSTREAVGKLQRQAIDLIIADANLDDGEFDGYDFVHWLRRSGMEPNAFTPVIMTSGHTSAHGVAKARDCGANIVVVKPLSPAALLQRIMWVAREKRLFVDAGVYVGPDRRFKNQGPPPGTKGRRSTDLSENIGAAVESNLSQEELDDLVSPQKAAP